jgi:hypothetical protein
MKNVGKTKIRVNDGFSKIQKIRPLGDELYSVINGNNVDMLNDLVKRRFIPWPLLCKRNVYADFDIEPNEEIVYTQDFLIPHDVSVFRVYTFMKSPTSDPGGPSGWAESMIYEVGSEVEDGNESSRSADGARLVCSVDE